MSEWDNVDFYIKEFHLDRWFDINKIVYSDGKIPGKPAPDIFLIAAKKINLNPADCIVVEDAYAGIKAAKSAGIGKIVAITSLEAPEYYKNMSEVDFIIKDFYEFDKNLLNETSRAC